MWGSSKEYRNLGNCEVQWTLTQTCNRLNSEMTRVTAGSPTGCSRAYMLTEYLHIKPFRYGQKRCNVVVLGSSYAMMTKVKSEVPIKAIECRTISLAMARAAADLAFVVEQRLNTHRHAIKSLDS